MEGVLCSYFIIFPSIEKTNFDLCCYKVLCVHLRFFLKKEKVNIQR